MQASSRGRHKTTKGYNVPTPHQARLNLPVAYVSEGSLWLTVPQHVVKLLHDCALGTSEGGPCTAQDTAKRITATIGGVPPEATPELVSIRLSPEEAVFLKFAFGNLTAVSADRALSVQELWSACVQHNPGFPYRYVAYHHFRSKGWIPRSGLQYGTDLVLYEQHPSLVHSTVCVLIVPVKHNSQSGCDSSRATASTKQESQHACESSSKTGSIPDGHDGHLAWHSLEGINRLCTRVGKKLMLLYIQQQQAEANFTSPACLDQFAVAEHYIERWVPEATVNLL